MEQVKQPLNIMEEISEKIKKMMKESGIKTEKLMTKEEIEKIDLEEEKKLIEPYVLKKFGIVFQNAKTLRQFNFSESVNSDIREFMNNTQKIFLVLRGGTGTAKTCIAKIIFQRYLEKILVKTKYFTVARCNAEYIRALDFFDELKKQFDDQKGVEQLINYTSDFGLLIIDEVGATYGTENERIQFNRIIDNYYTAKKSKVILITNCETNKDLETYIGKPGFSRICEFGTIISFRGIDFRKQNIYEVVA